MAHIFKGILPFLRFLSVSLGEFVCVSVGVDGYVHDLYPGAVPEGWWVERGVAVSERVKR